MAACCPTHMSGFPTTMTGYPTMMDKYAKFDYYSPMNTTGYYPGMPTTGPINVPTTPFTSPMTTGTYGYPTTFGGYPTSTFGSFPNTWTGSFPASTFGANSWSNTFGSFPNAWTGSFPSTWTGSFPNSWTGSFPGSTFGSFPNTWTGSFPGNFGGFPSTWSGAFPTSFGAYPGSWMSGMTGSYGYPTTFGSFPNTWTGSFPTSNFGSYPTTFGPFGGNNWFNTPADKLYNIAFRPSSELEMYTLSNPIRMIDVEGNRQLYLCFELKGFKPEEVTVTLNKAERAVVVEAAHDIKEGKEHQISRKYSRKFVLPETLAKIDLTKVELKSCLTQEGYLVVECQLPKMTTEEIAKSPIMSELYNKLPFAGHNAVHNFGGFHSISHSVNNVKPVTVKTA